MSTEVELKFRLSPEFSGCIKQLQLLKDYSITKAIKQRLHSIYYDSPDFTLQKHRIALRIRKVSGLWIQTIKSGGTVKDGLHQHNEWEYPIANDKPDFSQLPDQRIADCFADKRFCKSLQPIFETDICRTTYLLEPAQDFKLEFCLDEGKIIARQLTQSICEIELELKSGTTSQLFHFAEALQKDCAFPLIHESSSKAMRGYALLSQ
ncbi:MAG: CYTH domain-containing protein [Burkholderiales bacterium]|nr:CYTH domain-containing protein [Burkholderiales bacterium]